MDSGEIVMHGMDGDHSRMILDFLGDRRDGCIIIAVFEVKKDIPVCAHAALAIKSLA